MSYPKVSIQIPTYNQQAFIKKTVESCLMQDYPNLEINIADDFSTDNTENIIQEYLSDNRIKYYKNDSNIGRVANYHKALYKYASGEWAVNLDGDDYFTDSSFISGAIESIIKLHDEHIIIYQANHDIEKIMEVLPESKKINEKAILVDGGLYFMNYFKIHNFFHCATLYKRSEALKLNFYTFDCLSTDFNSMAKLFLKGKILASSEKVAHWSRHQNNESTSTDEKKLRQEMNAIDELSNFALDYYPQDRLKQWSRKMKGYTLSTFVDRHHTAKQKRSAFKQVLINFEWDKLHIRQLIKTFLGSIGVKKH